MKKSGKGTKKEKQADFIQKHRANHFKLCKSDWSKMKYAQGQSFNDKERVAKSVISSPLISATSTGSTCSPTPVANTGSSSCHQKNPTWRMVPKTFILFFIMTFVVVLFLFYDCSGSCYNICLSDCVLLLVFSILETWLQLLVKSLVAKFVLLR